MDWFGDSVGFYNRKHQIQFHIYFQSERNEVVIECFDNFFVEKHKRLVSEGCYEVLHGNFLQLQSMWSYYYLMIWSGITLHLSQNPSECHEDAAWFLVGVVDDSSPNQDWFC